MQTTTFNLGTIENPKNIIIAFDLSPDESEKMKELLMKRQKVFAWGYEDMPGIDCEIVEHEIPTYPYITPVKQKRRRLRSEWALLLKEEVEKQWKVGFLEVVDDTKWLANIIVAPEKDGKVRMCVDYRHLNKAYPKDDFPLPHIDTLVDSAASSAMYSFIDGFSGYNQIKIQSNQDG